MTHKRFDLSQISSGILVPVLVLVAGLVAYFVLLPKFSEMRQSKAVLEGKRGSKLSSETQFANVKSLIADLKKKKTELEIVEQAVPAAPSIPELLANLDNLGGLSGVLITELKIKPKDLSVKQVAVGNVPVQPQVYPAGLEVMQIEISVKGGYNNLKAFLLNVEQNLRLFDVQALDAGVTESKTGTQEYSFVIDTYYQKQ